MFEIVSYYVGISVTSLLILITIFYALFCVWTYFSISLSWWWLNVRMHNKYKKHFDAPFRDKKFIRLRFLFMCLNPIYVFKELNGCEYGLNGNYPENNWEAYADFTKLIPSTEMRLCDETVDYLEKVAKNHNHYSEK